MKKLIYLIVLLFQLDIFAGDNLISFFKDTDQRPVNEGLFFANIETESSLDEISLIYYASNITDNIFLMKGAPYWKSNNEFHNTVCFSIPYDGMLLVNGVKKYSFSNSESLHPYAFAIYPIESSYSNWIWEIEIKKDVLQTILSIVDIDKTADITLDISISLFDTNSKAYIKKSLPTISIQYINNKWIATERIPCSPFPVYEAK